ncbi:glycogen debranching enzyme-like isoform X2 [Nematostella vectensis]|uniref:glycogen debranching enzyme-like isoform X2 n=1 Tax=Nematostella vectensis TaxID=45351 RepID=UPI0020774971|nr:glycogen debranching enzyme-like isoform X2 [Nematostella vectensis]
MAAQVRVLQLKPGENLENKLFRLQKGWILHFTLAASLQPYSIKLLCNHPKPGQAFNRTNYQELVWTCSQKGKCDNGDRHAEIKVHQAGSFHFYITFENCEKEKASSDQKCSGYFTVDPTLRINPKEILPLDSVCLQTVLSKCLGPLSQWSARLQISRDSGYNVIHFTPISELGSSHSSYSIVDQLKLNCRFDEPGSKKGATFPEVKKILNKMKTEWKMLSIVDIVLNHTANETEWLWQHPECSYNLCNSPHLRPAFVLDRLLWHFTCDIEDGKYSDRGIPPEVNTEHQIHLIGEILRNELIPSLKLWEFFCVDIEKTIQKFKTTVVKPHQKIPPHQLMPKELCVRPNPAYRRNSALVDLDLAVKLFNVHRSGAANEKEHFQKCCDALKEHLIALNKDIRFNEMQGHINAAIGNIQATMRYERLAGHGPKYPVVSRRYPLVCRYFTMPGPDLTLKEEEQLMDSQKGRHCMAHQGWIMGGDPLKDFAAPGSDVYLRREVIPWGDSVKLRYGRKPEDVPFLWNHMKEYAKSCASMFDGLRLDNCHSTPLHVAEYMLDAAREENPELYVVAELFTGSEAVDNVFVNRLGITSLIREAMSAHDAHEEGRLTYRYGGEPVGAFMDPLATKPFVPGIAHALYMDVTHDNENPFLVRSVYDALASSALVAMACCATGSSRGYDELVPHQVHVVEEKRLYMSAESKKNKAPQKGMLSADAGIMTTKRAINELHRRLGEEGYSQVYVDQIHQDVHAITRHCPDKRKTVVMVAHSAFSDPPDHLKPTQTNLQVNMQGIPPLNIPGEFEEILLEAMIVKTDESSEFQKDNKFINGLQSHRVLMQKGVTAAKSKTCRVVPSGSNNFEVFFDHFAPGSVIAFQVSMEPKVKQALGTLRSLSCAMYDVTSTVDSETTSLVKELDTIVSNLSLADLNRVLYRCQDEEADDGNGGGVYVLEDEGALTYCGLQGFLSVLTNVRQHNDLAHPICRNLRAGYWMMGYVVDRLMPFIGTRQLGVWLDKVFTLVKSCPRYLIPCYFDAVITPLYLMLLNRAWSCMSSFVKDGSSFVKALSLGSVQFLGLTRSASLPPLSPNLYHGPSSGAEMPTLMCMAAGLPHFSTGFMRCWGRDTFISLRGLMLTTGRYTDAKHHILGFAGCIRHGLIPNLLDGGRNPRYNCRDAVWWWLQAIQDYCTIAPDGLSILKEPVSKLFRFDNSDRQDPGLQDKPLHDIMQEAIQRQFIGVQFRERGAGPNLDSHMKNEGFNVTVCVNERTGFVYGGNKWNAGTWMDKVGDSVLAGNYGVPATPRDGSAVEIVGLLKSTVKWLADLCDKKQFPYAGVSKLQDGFPISWSYREWSEKLNSTFERYFWIPEEPNPELEGEEIKLVHRRGIYKDSYGATHRFADFQLRPNICIAMAVAPEMFNPAHAWKALDVVEEVLLGPLGMATLDHADWAYEGVYDNAADTTSYKSSKGFCYHQGPEWLWCIGPFLRARLHFAHVLNGESGLNETVFKVRKVLSKHKEAMNASPWRSLPELTNAGGARCRDSCEAQAWSVACVLDVLYDIEQLLAQH